MLKVENEKALVRDPRTGAILNTDIEALQRHRASRSIIKNQQKTIEDLESRLARVEQILLNTIINNKD
jgi:hypothetical protein